MTRSERNEARLLELHPQFAVRMRLLIKQREGLGKEPLITDGYRSLAAQEALWLSGARAAPPGHSYHALRLAADVVEIEGGRIPNRWDLLDYNETDYAAIAREAEALGMVSGHYWSRRDSPHLEYHKGFGPRHAFILARLADSSGNLPDDFFDPPQIARGGITKEGQT